LDLPPLRNHQEDIPALLNHFLSIHSKAHKKALAGFGHHVVDALTRYPWPENIRELNNAVEQMLLNTPNGSSINYSALPLAIREHPAVNPEHLSIPRGSDLHTVERILIEDTMNACNNNKELCAKTLGIGLRTLYRKLKEY
jgi:DNA-binding NtrC family response regulator